MGSTVCGVCVCRVCGGGGSFWTTDVLLLLSLHFIHVVCTGAGSSRGDTTDNRCCYDNTLLCVLS